MDLSACFFSAVDFYCLLFVLFLINTLKTEPRDLFVESTDAKLTEACVCVYMDTHSGVLVTMTTNRLHHH